MPNRRPASIALRSCTKMFTSKFDCSPYTSGSLNCSSKLSQFFPDPTNRPGGSSRTPVYCWIQTRLAACLYNTDTSVMRLTCEYVPLVSVLKSFDCTKVLFLSSARRTARKPTQLCFLFVLCGVHYRWLILYFESLYWSHHR